MHTKSTTSIVRQALCELIGAEAVTLTEGLGRLVITTSGEVKELHFPQVNRNILASLTGNSFFDHINNKARLAKQKAMASIGLVEDCAILRHEQYETRWKMILRDASEAGKWRTQSFDERGFSGHATFETQEQAIHDAANSNYSIRDDLALDRIQDTPSFQRGLFVSELVSLVNTGHITHKQADERLASYGEATDALHSIAENHAQAFISAGGATIYLLADRIELGTEKAVFLHEISHRYGRMLLGQSGWRNLVATLHRWGANPMGSVERLIYDRASVRAQHAANDSPVIFEDELFAYGVEEAVNLGIKPQAMAEPESAARWLDLVVTSLRTMLTQLQADATLELTGQQLVDMAYAMAQIENPARLDRIRQVLTADEVDSINKIISRAGSPKWYSVLEAKIRQQSQNQMPAQQWADWVRSLTGRGVKKDEIEWSGILDWLSMQEGSISKASLVDFISSNGVRVEELMLRPNNKTKALELLSSNGFEIDRNEAQTLVLMRDGLILDASQLNSELKAAFERLTVKNEDGLSLYEDYALPGMTNYREVLLRLPEVAEDLTELIDRFEKRYETLTEIVKEFQSEGQLEQAQKFERKAAVLRAEIDGLSRVSMQKRKANFADTHWNRLNVLAHIRMSDRVDPSGRKVLFIEEIQSDWGQDAKRLGIRGDKIPVPVGFKFDDLSNDFVAVNSAVAEQWGIPGQDTLWDTPEIAIAKAKQQLQLKGVPNAPFISTTKGWLSLALKRIISLAVEGDYADVAFINGQQSVDRFGLRKSIEKIVVSAPNPYGARQVTIHPKNDLNVRLYVKPDGSIETGKYDGFKLSKVLGQSCAASILGNNESQVIQGHDLSFGGDGMIAFYDELVPNTLKAILKKMGRVPLTQVHIGLSNGEKYAIRLADNTWATDVAGIITFDSRAKAQAKVNNRNRFDATKCKVDLAPMQGGEQLGFTVNADMKKMAQLGMPLFSFELTSAVAQYAEDTQLDLSKAQRQCAAVVSRYIGTQNWMKSPNGLPTKLTQSQWVLVRTENFKKWFGDWELDAQNASQVVDGETGEPQVVYHGANEAGFAVFDPELRSGGHTPSVYFSSDPYVAKTYAGTKNEAVITESHSDEDDDYEEPDSMSGIYPVFLNIRNPNICDFEGANWDGDRSGQWVVENEDGESVYSESGKLYFNYDEKHLAQALADENPGCEVVKPGESFETTNSVVTEARMMKCDGAIMYDVVDVGPYGCGEGASNVFVIFKSAQAKSATVNNGEFDPACWDIRYSFIGPQAYPFTKDNHVLDGISDRLKAGEDPETLRQETGWQKGSDQKWRFELDDSQAELKISIDSIKLLLSQGPMPLSQILKHDSLFAAYPLLADIGVMFHADPGAGASYSHADALITLPLFEEVGNAHFQIDGSSMLRKIMHETQHAIQHREGFASGGSVMDQQDPEQLIPEIKERLQQFIDIDTNAKNAGVSPVEYAKGAHLPNQVIERVQDLTSGGYWNVNVENARVSLISAYQKYRNLAGEVEARNVETRINMSQQERRELAPEATRDTDHQTAIRSNFSTWFDGSHAVDAHGLPLRLYHGTTGDFSAFNRTKGGEFGPAIYITDNPQEAAEYGAGQQKSGVNVMPVYVSIKRPFTAGVEAFWQEFGREDGDAAALERAKLAGYDGVIIVRPITRYDNALHQFIASDETLTHFVVFDPTQVKSAIGNNGSYDQHNANICQSVSRFEQAESSVESLLRRSIPRSHNALIRRCEQVDMKVRYRNGNQLTPTRN